MNESSGRKVGIARFFELLGRDLWSFYRASFLCCAAFLPGFAAVLFGLMAHLPLLCALGGALGGVLAGPFLVGLADTVLRALRDEPGYWWHTYRRAWRQNWRQSLVPGALLGLFLGGWSAVLFHMVNDANPGTMMWVAAVVGMFVCVGFFVWLFAQIPLVDLPLPELIKNAALMFFGFLPRTLAADAITAVYWVVMLLTLPASIIVIVVFGFWLPVIPALMVVYPGLDKVFRLEETLQARRDAEINERMAAREAENHDR